MRTAEGENGGAGGSRFPEGKGTSKEEPSSSHPPQLPAQARSPCSSAPRLRFPLLLREAIPGAPRGDAGSPRARAGGGVPRQHRLPPASAAGVPGRGVLGSPRQAVGPRAPLPTEQRAWPSGSNPTGVRRQSTKQAGVLGSTASAGTVGLRRAARCGELSPLHQSRRETTQGCAAARGPPARTSAKK